MTTYRIVAPHFVAALDEEEGRVLQAAPILGWTVGKEFFSVRDYCKNKGWSVEPLHERSHPSVLELDDRVFELRWRGDVLARVSEHLPEGVRDIKFDDLPEILKRLC